jgi:tetratricopeptide (TPR) repeat protein
MLMCCSARKMLSIAVLSGLVLYFSIASYHINTHWKTGESFWQQSVKYLATDLAHWAYGLAIVGKNPELAEHHYLEAIQQNPSHIYANISLGMLHIQMGKEEEGLVRLQRMVALNPNWALAHYWLSEGLRITGQIDEALKEITVAADSDTRSLQYQYAAAQALQKAGKPAESIPYYERIMGLDPDYWETGFWLGLAYQKTAQPQKAIDTYNRFLQRNPGYVQVHFNLAYTLMAENDCKTAVIHFKKTLELNSGYQEAHMHLSTCYRILGDENSAEKHDLIYKEIK